MHALTHRILCLLPAVGVLLVSGCNDSVTPATTDSGVDRPTFWTSDAGDFEAPQVTLWGPTSTDVLKTADVFATVSEDLMPTILENALRVERASDHVPVDGASRYEVSTRTFHFDLAGRLAPNTTYIAILSSRHVRDLAGHPLARDFAWNFTTGNSTDVSPLHVRSITPRLPEPAPLDASIVVTFNEPVNPTSVTLERFVVRDTSINQTVTGPITCDREVCTLTPDRPLRANATYSVVISGAIRDADGGHTLSGAANATFRTRALEWSTTTPSLELNPTVLAPNSRGDALIVGQRAALGRRALVAQLFDGRAGAFQRAEQLEAPVSLPDNPPIPVSASLNEDRDICLIGGRLNREGGIAASSTTLYSLMKNGTTGQWSRPFVLGTVPGAAGPQARTTWDGHGRCVAIWVNSGQLFATLGSRTDLSSERLWSPIPYSISASDGGPGDVTDIDMDAVGPGRVRIVWINRAGIPGEENQILSREYQEGVISGFVQAESTGSVLTGIRQEVDEHGASALFWLKNTSPAEASPVVSELWWNSASARSSVWNTRTGQPIPQGGGLVSASIRSAGLADTGEINVQYTEYRAGSDRVFRNHDSLLFQNATRTWGSVPTSLSQGSAGILFSSFDRYGGGFALANLPSSGEFPSRVQGFLKLPGRSLFDFGGERPPLWTYRDHFGVLATMDREGRVFSVVNFQDPDTGLSTTQYHWLR